MKTLPLVCAAKGECPETDALALREGYVEVPCAGCRRVVWTQQPQRASNTFCTVCIVKDGPKLGFITKQGAAALERWKKDDLSKN